MGYVDSNLLKDEVVMYRTRLHKIVFLKPSLFTIGCIYLTNKLPTITLNENYILAAKIGVIVFALWTLLECIQYQTCEFAVTNKRLILKTGLISRYIKETLLRQIEAIQVDQSILGRILQYGDVLVLGTGGTQEPFRMIANPLTFRRAIQEQSDNNR